MVRDDTGLAFRSRYGIDRVTGDGLQVTAVIPAQAGIHSVIPAQAPSSRRRPRHPGAGPVIPAKAGIHSVIPAQAGIYPRNTWAPAFAGATMPVIPNIISHRAFRTPGQGPGLVNP
jgi:hypothetical protein